MKLSRNRLGKLKGEMMSEELSADYAQGFAAGKRWGSQEASDFELARIARVRSRFNDNDWRRSFVTHGTHEVPAGERLASNVIQNDGLRGKPNRSELAEVWKEMAGEACVDRSVVADFVRGVAEGALVEWEKIKDQIPEERRRRLMGEPASDKEV